MPGRIVIITLLSAILVGACSGASKEPDFLYFQDYTGSLNCQHRLGYTVAPQCLNKAHFEIQQEFDTCRKSIDSYATEFDRWKACRAPYLEALNERVIEKVTHYRRCLEGRYPEDPPCRTYRSPQDLRAQSLGSPTEEPYYKLETWQKHCLRYDSGTEVYSKQACEEATKAYLDSVFNHLKQGYKEDVKRGDSTRDKAIKLFNCKSKAKDDCS